MSASGLATFQAPKTLSIFKKTDQHFYNLYFFRNMISNQVLISKTFQFDNEKGAKQLRMNRNQLKLRKDHFVSFMVLTGIKSTEIQDKLYNRLLHLPKGQSEQDWEKRNAPKSKSLTNLPLKKNAEKTKENPLYAVFPGWSIPKEVKYTTIGLCKMLNRLIDPAKKYPDLVKKEDHDWSDITIHWERDEYQSLVNHRVHPWPEIVTHKPLKLIRNRYPVVPGFDTKSHQDIVQLLGIDADSQEAAKKAAIVKKSDFEKKRTTWKVKNKIVKAPDVLHKYASKFGKSYPVIKTTAETSRYRLEREAKKAEREEKEKQKKN